MRVLIYYQPNSNRDAFEGDRLRKTLKGECESMGIEWVDSRYSKPDIAHFVSDKDLGLMRRMKAKGVKTVVSAFYCERDLDARMLIADPKGQFFLRPKAKKMLNEADIQDAVLKLRGIEALKDMADGRATKIYMPTDLSDLITSLGVAGEALGGTGGVGGTGATGFTGA